MLAAACMTVCAAFAQKTIRVSTEKTDLVLKVSPKGRLYQVYLGDRLLDASDYDQLKWDVYAASDGSVCQRGKDTADIRALQSVGYLHAKESETNIP